LWASRYSSIVNLSCLCYYLIARNLKSMHSHMYTFFKNFVSFAIQDISIFIAVIPYLNLQLLNLFHKNDKLLLFFFRLLITLKSQKIVSEKAIWTFTIKLFHLGLYMLACDKIRFYYYSWISFFARIVKLLDIIWFTLRWSWRFLKVFWDYFKICSSCSTYLFS